MTTPLAGKIKALIEADGPLSLSQYFSLCLSDPEYGYYRHNEPFGTGGDFVTAPEISQLFGEMIGIFVVGAWQAHGTPTGTRLVELGPGRGTMMADVLRVVERLAPELHATMTVHLVEMSDRLREIQRRTLGLRAESARWHRDLADVPDGFTLLVANEFFDAIPIRQYVRTDSGFRERVVGLGVAGDLAFLVGPGRLDVDEAAHAGVEEGTVIEVSPAREAIMAEIAARLLKAGGTALVIDYGHLATGFGDTLQALKGHVFDPPLAHPGEADLTSHVDFAALAAAAGGTGAHIAGGLSQGDFLLGLGLLERAGRLGAGKDAAVQDAIREAVERLAAPGAGRMGELFKVMAVSSERLPVPPFRQPE